jgi:hypothetical protein
MYTSKFGKLEGIFFNLLKKYTNVFSIFFIFFKLPDFLDELDLEIEMWVNSLAESGRE